MFNVWYSFKKSINSLKSIAKRKKKRGRPKKNVHRRKNVGTLLILGGFFILLIPLLYKPINSFIYSKKNSVQNSPIVKNNKPTIQNTQIKIDPGLLSTKKLSLPPERIIIPNQKINLPIVEAQVVDGFWEISETTASHGVGSAYPGDIGNVVIFAHAREGLFLPLKDVQKDDDIFVLSKDHWFRYQVKEIKDVNPDQIEVIAPTKDETLTLYTCSGFLDSKRRIVVGKRLY